MNKHLRARLNRANAQKSTGPRTTEGKRRSSLNAFRHNLSGNHLVLQPHEFEAYETRKTQMLADLKPRTEPEQQIAHKIIDLHFRLNRIYAIENNMLNFDIINHEPDNEPDNRLAAMISQAEAWKKEAHTFDLLGRYEARLSKQLLQYQKEFERFQTVRNAEVHATSVALSAQAKQTAAINSNLASFGKPVPSYVITAAPRVVSQSEPPRIPLPPLARFADPSVTDLRNTA